MINVNQINLDFDFENNIDTTRPFVLVYDDQTASVEKLCRALAKKFSVILKSTLPSFAEAIRNVKLAGGVIAFVVLDMHDPRVETLEKLNYPSIETQSGTEVGLVVAENILWPPEKAFGKVPVLLYSALDMPLHADVRIQKHKSSGLPIEFASKEGAVEDIIFSMEKYPSVTYPPTYVTKANEDGENFSEEEYRKAVSENIDAAKKWGFSLEEISRMFGKFSTSYSSEDKLLRAIIDSADYDLDARMTIIYEVRVWLDAAFKKSTPLHVDWLDVEQQYMEGNSVKNLLTSGRIDDMQIVSSFLQTKIR